MRCVCMIASASEKPELIHAQSDLEIVKSIDRGADGKTGTVKPKDAIALISLP